MAVLQCALPLINPTGVKGGVAPFMCGGLEGAVPFHHEPVLWKLGHPQLEGDLQGESGIPSQCSFHSSRHGNSSRSLVTSAVEETLVQVPWEASPPWGEHWVSGSLVDWGWAGIGALQEINTCIVVPPWVTHYGHSTPHIILKYMLCASFSWLVKG